MNKICFKKPWTSKHLLSRCLNPPKHLQTRCPEDFGCLQAVTNGVITPLPQMIWPLLRVSYNSIYKFVRGPPGRVRCNKTQSRKFGSFRVYGAPHGFSHRPLATGSCIFRVNIYRLENPKNPDML